MNEEALFQDTLIRCLTVSGLTVVLTKRVIVVLKCALRFTGRRPRLAASTSTPSNDRKRREATEMQRNKFNLSFQALTDRKLAWLLSKFTSSCGQIRLFVCILILFAI